MSIGQMWKKAILDREQENMQSGLRSEEKKAQDAIEAIPGRISWAIEHREDHARVYGWVSFQEVVGEALDKVDDLAMRLHEERRALRVDELAGAARRIVEWCDTQGLECFFVSKRVPLNGCEYHIHARPKRT